MQMQIYTLKNVHSVRLVISFQLDKWGEISQLDYALFSLKLPAALKDRKLNSTQKFNLLFYFLTQIEDKI